MIGASDTVNSDAEDDPASAIAGMPVVQEDATIPAALTTVIPPFPLLPSPSSLPISVARLPSLSQYLKRELSSLNVFAPLPQAWKAANVVVLKRSMGSASYAGTPMCAA